MNGADLTRHTSKVMLEQLKVLTYDELGCVGCSLVSNIVLIKLVKDGRQPTLEEFKARVMIAVDHLLETLDEQAFNQTIATLVAERARRVADA